MTAPGTALSPVLSVSQLSKAYNGVFALRDVDLDVRRGEVHALLGGNGSGKSTLVRALLGLVPLTRGSVELFGTPLRGFRSWRDVGYVPQRSTAGFAGAKVREEAEEVTRAAREESEERVAEEAADVLYHLLVLLRSRGLGLTDAAGVLLGRRR